MRLVLLTGNRVFQELVRATFGRQGLTIEAGTPRSVLAAKEPPAVVLHVERWDGEAAAQVRQLQSVTSYVYLICADATNPRTYVAMLSRGVRDAANGDELGLRILALKLQRVLREPEPGRWRVGRWLFVPAEGRLSCKGRTTGLTPTEVRILRRLCLASVSAPPEHLTVAELAKELRGQTGTLASRESAVRTHIAHLRHKLCDDGGQQPLLRHDGEGYWLVLGPASLD
jgi:DNA-binding response OmpR family regulator